MYPGANAALHPDRAAYIMASTGETITNRELDERSNRLAHLLRDRGLEPGDAIALYMDNHPRFLEIAWAAQRSGLTYTPISWRLTAEEASYIVNDCGAKALITSPVLAQVAEAIPDLTPGVSTYLACGDRELTPDGFESYDGAVGPYPTSPVKDEMEGNDLLYSSGTTGRPKGVRIAREPQPVGTPDAVVMLVKFLYGASGRSIYLSPAPLYHAAPLRFSMAFTRLGATVVVMEHFDPLQYLSLIERYSVTHSQVVPTMFVRILKLARQERERFDHSSLTCVLHASAPCPVPVKREMIEWWGPIIYEFYAGTESNGFVACDSHEWLAHPGTVGKPMLGAVHITDDEGNELPAGEDGAVWLEMDGTSFEYLNDPDKTASSHNDRGWSTLGDIGHVDSDGYLYLTDRKAYMIISGGVNIYPQETENILVTHPKVMDAAVFGIPDGDLGEAVKAVVQLVDPSEAEDPESAERLAAELIAFCRQHLARYKCPRTVDFAAELPRHPNGKLYKRVLRDPYWAGHESRIV